MTKTKARSCRCHDRTPLGTLVAGRWRHPAFGGLGETLACLALAALLLPPAILRAGEVGDTADHVKVVDEATLDLDDDAVANLTISAVTQESYPDVLSIMGAISPVENRITSVPARYAGRIDSVLKVTGEYVQAGDALALEYSPDFIQTRQEYLEALQKDAAGRADTSTAQAESATAQSAAENSDFFNLAAISRKKLENMGLTAQDIEALPTTGADGHLVIRASHAGAITAVNTTVGNMQNQGDNLMNVADLDQVWFSGDLYSEDLTKVHAGQEIIIQTEGLSRPLKGTISFISPVIDPNAHTIKIRAKINNPDRVLRSSMVVEGDIVLSRKTALVVPLGALMNLHDDWYCFKRIGKNRFKEIKVQMGQEFDDSATVAMGLALGDEVVSGGNLVMDYTFSGN
jgi:RND family efflux transporter MFP subunit